MVHGAPGCGKTTLGASIPNSIIIDAENGSNEIDCARVVVSTWEEVVPAIREAAQDKACETIVLDTIDRIASYAKSVLTRQTGGSLNEGNLSFGKGKDKLEYMLLDLRDTLRATGKSVLYLAHSQIIGVPSNTAEERSVWGPSLPNGLERIFIEDVSVLAYGCQVYAKDGSSQRVLYTSTPHAAVKTRLGSKPVLPMDWTALVGRKVEQALIDKALALMEPSRLEDGRRWLSTLNENEIKTWIAKKEVTNA
jgi:hypothetical protein